jgi:glycosyltransferase involved in cell wall biosynthesis
MTGAAEARACRESQPFLEAPKRRIRVLVLDLWCYVPYYDRYFCESLLTVDVEPRLAAASNYLDPEYFKKHGIRNRPGFMDIAARFRLSNQRLRRSLMLAECCLNLVALAFWILLAKPEILHVQWIPLVQKLPFDLWFMKFAKLRGVKIVYTVHNTLPHDTGKRLKDVYRQVYSQADALISHTQEAKTQLQVEFSIDADRIWVIPHGSLFHDVALRAENFRTRSGIAEDECLVLMQGMLKPYKGVGFLLEAWRHVSVRNLKARLLIVGIAEPEFEKEIRNRVIDLGIRNSVSLDFRYVSDEELSAYYQASDILVYPYKSITASGALMTGLSFGKAIIVTTLPAFQEVLEEGKSASFVKFGDVDSLAASLSRLIQEPTERMRLATAAMDIGRLKYSWSSIAAQTRSCYLAVLDQNYPR